jgi:hypothetical protein
MVSYGSHFRNHVSAGKGTHAKPFPNAQAAIRSAPKDRRGLLTPAKYTSHVREVVGENGCRRGIEVRTYQTQSCARFREISVALAAHTFQTNITVTAKPLQGYVAIIHAPGKAPDDIERSLVDATHGLDENVVRGSARHGACYVIDGHASTVS